MSLRIVVLSIIIIIANCAQNITIETTSIQLPTYLQHPITVYYNNTLITIPSNVSNKIYYLSPFTDTDLQSIDTTVNFTLKQIQQPYIWPHPISCSNIRDGTFKNCYATRNEYLYIIQQPLDSWNYWDEFYLLTFNMQTNEFINSSTYKYNFGTPTTFDVMNCMYFIDDVLTVWSAYQLYRYNTTSNEWLDLYTYKCVNSECENPSFRFGAACAVVSNFIYIFGGVIRGIEFAVGEKCVDFPVCEYLVSIYFMFFGVLLMWTSGTAQNTKRLTYNLLPVCVLLQI
eukprot:307323_1